MNDIDNKNRLEEEPFSYRVNKNNTILIDYYGRQVKVVKGAEAEKLLQKINSVNDGVAKQLIMAKITGNFKRGNERK